MKIVFIDMGSPVIYNDNIFTRTGLGATTTNLVLVAEGLAKRGYQVTCVHHQRQEREISKNGVVYTSLADCPQKPDLIVLIVVVKYKDVFNLRLKFPNVPCILWFHTIQAKTLRKYRAFILKLQATILCVSHYQKTVIETILKEKKRDWKFKKLPALAIRVIYPIILDELKSDATPVDPHKLLFLSSPHKGLSEVIRIFLLLKKQRPHYKLYVCNPGYREFPEIQNRDDIVILGSLLHARVIEELRSAFLVFYPQTKVAETFGFIFAEANAVGTPVIAHDFGAAREVLRTPEQCVDATDHQQVIDRVIAFEQKRPVVSFREEFHTRPILDEWEVLFNKLLRR